MPITDYLGGGDGGQDYSSPYDLDSVGRWLYNLYARGGAGFPTQAQGAPSGQSGIGSDARIPMAGQVGQPMGLPGAQPPAPVGATVPSTAGVGLRLNQPPGAANLAAYMHPNAPAWLRNFGSWLTGGSAPGAPMGQGGIGSDAVASRGQPAASSWNWPTPQNFMFGLGDVGQPPSLAAAARAPLTSTANASALTSNATQATAPPGAYGYPTWPSGGGSAGPQWSHMPFPGQRDPTGQWGPAPAMPPGRARTAGPASSTATPSGAGTPVGNPSATPRPANRTRQPFGLVQYGVPGAPGSSNAPLSRNPIYTTWNLFGGQ